MKTFVLTLPADISVFASKAEAAKNVDDAEQSAGFFSTAAEFKKICSLVPMANLVEIWNSLAGVTPVKKFADRGKAANRIWDQIQHLQPAGDGVQPAKAKTAKAKGKAKRNAKKVKTAAAHEGSKKELVVAMLKRKGGAKRSEIMEATGWQQHTVRGFLSIYGKKTGAEIKSAAVEGGGDRVYSL